MGNSPRDCGPGGQWLGFMFIWWGIVLMGSCPRTVYSHLVYYTFCVTAQPRISGLGLGLWSGIRVRGWD